MAASDSRSSDLQGYTLEMIFAAEPIRHPWWSASELTHGSRGCSEQSLGQQAVINGVPV